MTSRSSIAGRLRLSAISCLTLSLLALSGCSNGDAPPGEPTSGAPSSASPSASVTPSASPSPKPKPVYKPADAKGRAQNVPVPVKPALADKNSKEGLEAFSKYWYSLMSYAYETGNLQPVDEVTAENCASCGRVRSTIQSWNTKGRWIEGGAFEILDATTTFKPDANGYQQVLVQYHRLSVNYRQADGTIKQSFQRSSLLADIFLATYRANGWFVTNVDRVGG